MGEMQTTPAANFIIEELSWVIGFTLGGTTFSRPWLTFPLLLPGRDRKHAVQVLGVEQRGQRVSYPRGCVELSGGPGGYEAAAAATECDCGCLKLSNCSPGPPPHPQRLPRQRPSGEQGLHHRRRGKSTRPGICPRFKYSKASDSWFQHPFPVVIQVLDLTFFLEGTETSHWCCLSWGSQERPFSTGDCGNCPFIFLQEGAQLDMFCLDLDTWTWTQM